MECDRCRAAAGTLGPPFFSGVRELHPNSLEGSRKALTPTVLQPPQQPCQGGVQTAGDSVEVGRLGRKLPWAAGVVGHVHWYWPGCLWEHGLMIPLGLGCHEQERRRIWCCLCRRADEVEVQVRGPREAELS